MMSKNLFLVNLKKNMRRRLWLIVINLLVLFFALPISAILGMGQYGSSYMYEQLPIMKTFAFVQAVGITNAGLIIVAALLAIYAGISGFSYMYNKSKLDFYMSSPVDKNIRFFVIYINGFIIFTLAYVLNLILACIIGASQYVNIASVLPSVMAEFGLVMLTFFSCYNITLIAVMLTGNLPVAVLGSATLILYPLGMCTMIEAFCNFYLRSFYTPKSKIYNFDYSPLTIFLKAQGEGIDINWSKMLIEVKQADIFINGAIKVFVTGLVFLFLAKLLYNKKPAENCGKSFAYIKAGIVIKVLVTLFIAIGFGCFCYSVTGSANDTFMVLGLIIGVLFGHCLMQVIINGDLKSTVKGLGSLLVSAALTGLVFTVFKFDLTRFDSYVPKADQVESASFYFPAYWWCSYYDNDSTYIDNEEWIEKHMSLTCLDNAVIPLAQKRMPGLCPDGRVEYYEDDSKEYAVISYHMKNGNTIYRKLWFDIYEDEAMINTIFADDSFYSSVSALDCQEYTSKFSDSKFSMYIQQGFDNIKIENIKAEEFFDIYKKDFYKLNFTDMRDKMIVGQVSGELNKPGFYMSNMFPIYESFDDTIAYLESKGYSIDYKLNPDLVASMDITNYHNEMTENNQIIIGESQDYTVSMEVTDREQIAEVSKYCYPSMMNNFWVPKDRFDGNYYIEVRTKSSMDYDAKALGVDYAYDSTYTSYSYQFLKDKVPQIVVEGTALN